MIKKICMISKPVKRFVELMKSNPDDFYFNNKERRSFHFGLQFICFHQLFDNFGHQFDRQELLSSWKKGQSLPYTSGIFMSFNFFSYDSSIGLYNKTKLVGPCIGCDPNWETMPQDKFKLNVLERLIIKRNLKKYFPKEFKELDLDTNLNIFDPTKAKIESLIEEIFLKLNRYFKNVQKKLSEGLVRTEK